MFIRKHVYFYGRVQGVGFRWRAVQTAKDLHLTGWVRNMYNGNVEMEVQGNSVMIERLFQELHSDRFIRIEQPDRIITGRGFDSNEQMTVYTIRKPEGIFYVDDDATAPADSVQTDSMPKDSIKP